MNVRLPDGTVIQNVPDGISRMELATKLKANGQAVPSEWLSASPAPKPDPSVFDQAISGLKQGAGDVVKGIGALPTMIADAPGHLVNAAAGAMGYNFRVPSFAAGQDAALQRAGMASQPGFGSTVRQGLASVASGAPIGGVMSAAPGMVGKIGATMASQPIQQAIGTTAGGVTGEGLRQIGAPPVLQMLGGMAAGGAAGAPRPTDAARRLAERGVQMTPGQLIGGGANTVEQALGSIPFIGDIIKNQRAQGVGSFNTAVLDQALAPIGKKIPKGLDAQEQLTHVRTTLGKEYDTTLGKMKGDLYAKPPANAIAAPGQIGQPPGPSLFDELTTLKTMGANLPAQQYKDLTRIIDQDIVAKFTKGGKASGETLQDINRVLDSEIADFGKSQDPYHQKLGQTLKETQAAIRRMIARENPQEAAKLNAIDSGYVTFKQAQAGAKRGKDGNYTPSQFEAGIKEKDQSKDKRGYTEGTIPNQGLASDARKVLPNTLPDSGTATRALIESLALGGGAALHPGMLAAGAAVPGVYNPLVLQAIQKSILSGQQPDVRLLNAMRAGMIQTPPQQGQQ